MTRWYPPMSPIYLPLSILKKNPKHWIQFELKGLPKNYFWRGMFMNARSRNWVGFICGGGGRYKMGFFRACCSCHMPERLRYVISHAWWNTGAEALVTVGCIQPWMQRSGELHALRKQWTRTGMSSFFSKEPGPFILAHYLFEAAFWQFQKREIYADVELETQAG